MKHLKKLSVVLMMTTLFSVSFTSCIDNEVSPLVEAIYEAQADLIAAQAGVQNAEAALLLAQANAAQAQASSDAQVNEDLAAGQLAILIANAGLTDAQAAMIMAQAQALADMTAAQVLKLIADAGLTDAQAALIIAQSNSIEDMTAAQVLGLIASANLTDAQAAMVLAQASALDDLTAAQVAQLLANAGYTDAETAWLMAAVARYEAETAQNALIAEQHLLELIAETNLNVAEAQNALALAQVTFQTQMANAVAQMEAAGAQIAVGYAWDYAGAMQHANSLMQDLLGAQADLANAQLMQTNDGFNNVSWEFYLAQMEGAVATNMAAKASIEDAIADLQAYIANPTTPESMLTTLKAENDALDALRDAKEIEMQVQWNKIMAIYDEAGVRDEFVLRYEDALAELNDAIAEKQIRLDDIELAEGDIADWQLALDDYPTALAGLELAVSDAEAAVTAAEAALDAANVAKWAADDVLAAADADLIDANTALSDLNAELALLNLSYLNAIQDLADETALYNAGLPAAQAALLAAQATLAAAEADVLVAQADYDAKQLAFEANPTGFVWTGGANGAVGLHADATTPTNSYREVNLTDNGVLALSLSAGAGNDMTGTYGTYAAFLVDATAGALVPGDYYNVGGDDVAGGTNADRLELAADALTLALDAIAPLEAAVAVEQDIVDNFGDALAAAQLVYDHQKDLYDNQLALVVAAEAVVDAADAAQVAAAADLVIKIQAVTDADNDLTDANTDLSDAQADLAAFLVCDDVCLQANIDGALANIADWTAEIALIQPIIDAKQAIVDAMEVEAEGYIASEGVLSNLYADLHAEIIAEWQVYWTMEQELDALNFQENLNDEMINIYGGWGADDLTDLADYLANLQSQLSDAIYDIEVAEQALAAAQVEEAADEAYIAYLEALVDTLEQRHANTLAIAAKYKALMDAALAS
ncbi:MAG TPA: hypothetical protein VIO43_01950 [Lutibacter sp.]